MATRGGVGGDREEFVEEAPVFVLGPRKEGRPRITGYSWTSGPLEALLYTMLRRAWCSRMRKRKPLLGLPEDAAEWQAPDRYCLFAEPFSARRVTMENSGSCRERSAFTSS